MPRANRSYAAGQVWHLTHRCHNKEFLLKFAKDRDCWTRWLFEATKRYGLSVLNYIVTSNHIHLLVRDRGKGEILKSMQLIAGQTAQRYNKRKCRKGAFWEDRYHATAVQTDCHLQRCLVYIDLNMVRAGVVTHPERWRHSGYCEIQSPPDRYAIIDRKALVQLCGFTDMPTLQSEHRNWIAAALAAGGGRDPIWTESFAVGTDDYIRALEASFSSRRNNAVEEPTYYYRPQNMTDNRSLSL